MTWKGRTDVRIFPKYHSSHEWLKPSNHCCISYFFTAPYVIIIFQLCTAKSKPSQTLSFITNNNKKYLKSSLLLLIIGDNPFLKYMSLATPITPLGIKRKRRPIRSPYFTVRSCHSSTTKSQRSSRHFLHSPSSTQGSLRHLGPIIYTWSQFLPPKCTRPPDCCHQSLCNPCLKFLHDATRHFVDCPQFRETFYVQREWTFDDNTPCLLVVGQVAERCVRHLCANRCYLRAFAPSRDWVAMRKDLAKATTEPIGRVETNEKKVTFKYGSPGD